MGELRYHKGFLLFKTDEGTFLLTWDILPKFYVI